MDPADPAHSALVALLGAKAKHEVVRARHRTLAAMRAQTVEQGRFLGGRPPYGYRLVGAGPHPNRAEAAWGRRLHRLGPDAVTAAHVRWMFARRLKGRLSAQDRGRDAVEGLVPGNGPQRGTLVIASQWRGEPVGMAQQRSRGGALPAQPAAVRRELPARHSDAVDVHAALQ